MRDAGPMPGPLALIGGGEFTPANDTLDRLLVEHSGAGEVLVVPTADAFENPAQLVAAAERWFASLGVRAVGVPLFARADASDPGIVAQLAAGRLIYFVGYSQLHLRAVLKDSPAWEAVLGAWRGGAAVAAAGPAATGICDPMLDSRNGAVTFGLAIVEGLTFVPRAEQLPEELLHRTRQLVHHGAVVEAATGGALLVEDGAWQSFGEVVIQGDLPTISAP